MLAAAPIAVDVEAGPSGERFGSIPSGLEDTAVVTGKDEERVLGCLRFVERFEDSPDGVIEIVNPIAEGTGGSSVAGGGGGRDGLMDGDGGEIQEEGGTLVLLADPIDGAGGEDVYDVDASTRWGASMPMYFWP